MERSRQARYGHWASYYEAFEKPGSTKTWRLGIIPELIALDIDPGEVLDLGAGTGIGYEELRQLYPHARIRGLDISADMLDASRIPPELRIHADMSSFELPDKSVDCVVSGYDALNTLDKYALTSCLQRVGCALRSGGYFVFDYSSSELIRHVWADMRFEREQDGLVLEFAHSYEAAHDRSRVTLRMRRGTETEWTEVHHHYSYDPVTMRELMKVAGLRILKIRNLAEPYFSPSSEAHVYVVQRC
jgi:ubiquinone/menaquinone biosynthesis C-methylase UbiE